MGVEQPTCGTGLAEHSSLPARVTAVMAAMADVLEHHTAALDSSDPETAAERDAYVSLVGEHREIAARLEANATEMAGYRDLPMGRHHADVISSPAFVGAFERFVGAKQDLLLLLRDEAEQDQQMLVEMQGGAGGEA
jgi:hypothetical protein